MGSEKNLTEKEILEQEIARLQEIVSSRRSKLTSLYNSLVTAERSKERCIFLKQDCLKTLREIKAAPIVKMKVWVETKAFYEKNVGLITKYKNDIVSKNHEANQMEKDVETCLSMIKALQNQNDRIGVVLPFKKVP